LFFFGLFAKLTPDIPRIAGCDAWRKLDILPLIAPAAVFIMISLNLLSFFWLDYISFARCGLIDVMFIIIILPVATA